MSTFNQQSTINPDVLITVFPSLTKPDYEEHLIPLQDLPAFIGRPQADDKAGLPLFKAARFSGGLTAKGSSRADRFVLSRSGVEIDYDAGKTSLEKAYECIQEAGLVAILYTTPSWTKAKPKWRAFFPFSQERKGPVEFLKAWSILCVDYVEDLLPDPVANESRTLSQAFYYGSVKGNKAQFLVSTGEPLDLVVEPPKPKNSTSEQGVHEYMTADRQQELYEVIHTGSEGVHEALRDLSMMFVNRGQDGPSVRALLETLMRHANWGTGTEGRWQDRFYEIPRLVESAVGKKIFSDAAGDAEEIEDKLKAVSTRFTIAELAGGLKPPESVVEGYMLAAEAGGLVSQGGTGKTTLAIYESIHIILGWDLYGLAIIKPGKVLFMTAEDRRETVGFRLGQIINQLGLKKEELNKVIDSFICIDLSHDGLRLLTANKFGNLIASPLADSIIENYRNDNIAYIHIDPVSLVGPGETSGNDGMAELLRISRRLAKELKGAVRLVHHTSKAVAMEGTLTQYAGRGGAAFADNSRFQHQLTSIDRDQIRVGRTDYLVPPELGATPEDYQFGRVLALLRHKMSYSELDTRPIFILRKGFSYRHEYGIAQASRTTVRGGPSPELRQAVLDFITSENSAGRYHTGRSFGRIPETDLPAIISRMSQRDRTGLIEELLSEGIVEEVPILPPPARGRRIHLQVVDSNLPETPEDLL